MQESPGLSGRGKKRATDQDSCREIESQGSVHIEYEEARGARLESHLGKTTGLREPRFERKHQGTAETSLLHHCQVTKGQKMEDGSCVTQDLTRLQNACSLTKTRASFSFHKKKIVTAVSEGAAAITLGSPLSESPYQNIHTTLFRTEQAVPIPRHSSSMYLLTP